ncbi:hypothetical protein CSAL01_08136 [Colletotrichum salicis]|uniref:Uncharacterized protein n=1 Tax=Colletotrichum salicis TaxID=1209931 RepID=A0A135UUC8_9PEZI|nr:hypothetical protein CSAL01_08136 [Colletotrichum salicis]
MGFIPPHILKAKAASQDVSAEEREASQRTLDLDGARRVEREGKGGDGEKGTARGGSASSTEAKEGQEKGEVEKKK